MSNKIILNLAISVDGYIADNDDGYAWIQGDGKNVVHTNTVWSHQKFLENIDIVVMGQRCYELQMHLEYTNKQIYVMTSKDLKDYDNVHFISGDNTMIIKELKEKTTGDIYLFGGGKSIDTFIKEDSIDEYIIGIIPIILGNGIPLFLGNNPTIPLTLKGYYIEDGVTVLHYLKR